MGISASLDDDVGIKLDWLGKFDAVFGANLGPVDLRAFDHGAMENKGLNLFPDTPGVINDVAPFGLQSARQDAAAKVWAELRTEYNVVVSRFTNGVGTDLPAPDKAAFRHVSHTRGIG